MSNVTNKLKRETFKKSRKEFTNIANMLAPVGMCKCGCVLVTYLDSKPENRFNIYCIGENSCSSISDIRKPKPGDEFSNKKGDSNIQTLMNIYKTFKNIEITDEDVEKTPISEVVNDIHGDI